MDKKACNMESGHSEELVLMVDGIQLVVDLLKERL